MTSEQIKKAAREFLPVRYGGIKYRRISAVIWRIQKTREKGTFKEILQCVLEDYCGNSETIAEPEKVELAEG